MAGAVNGSDSRKLTPFDRRKLQRAIAEGDRKRVQIARDFGVSPAYITQFAKRYAREIDEIKRDLDDAYAGLWIADKENRILAYQTEYTMALGSDRANHHEWIKARTAILHTVSEELGQLPPRATVAVMPVVHIIEGVDVEGLK
jgi:DNA-binding transcriptional regulator GbsR (MarR family)